MRQGGFTILELLVVIAIIGLLASIVLVNVRNARARARDTRRKSEIHQIEHALKAYYQAYGTYPADNEWGGDCSGSGDEACNGYIGDKDTDGVVDIDDALAEFAPKTPADPSFDGTNYYYYYDHRHCCSPPYEGCMVTIHVQTMESLNVSPDTPCNDDDSEFCDNPCDCGGEGKGDNAHYLIPLDPCD